MPDTSANRVMAAADLGADLLETLAAETARLKEIVAILDGRHPPNTPKGAPTVTPQRHLRVVSDRKAA